MKKTIFLLAIIALVFNAVSAQQGIQFVEHEKWANILAKAKKENKMIFMDAYTSWCGPCKMLAAQIFPQAEVGAFYNENFINTHYDMEKDEGVMLANNYGVNMYPTLLIIDGDGKIVTRTAGFMPAATLIEFGRGALGKAEKVQDWAKKYEEGDKSPETLRGYALALRRTGASAVKVANEYIATQKDLTTPENLKFIFDAAERYDSKIFELLLQYKDKMILQVGKQAFETKIKGAAQGTLQNAYEFKSIDLLKQAQKIIKENVGGDFAKQFEINSNMEFYKKTGDENNYVKAAKKYASAAGKDVTKLAQLVQAFDQNVKKPENLCPAIKWAKTVAETVPNYENYFIYARLLQKTGDKKRASTAAKKAIEIGTAAGIPIGNAQFILDQCK